MRFESTCKVGNDVEAELLYLARLGLEGPEDEGEDVGLDVGGRGLGQEELHPLHEDQQNLGGGREK